MKKIDFPISRICREKYAIAGSLYLQKDTRSVIHYRRIQTITTAINTQLDQIHHPGPKLRTGQLYVIILINEVLHYVIDSYVDEVDPAVMQDCLSWLGQRISAKGLGESLRRFAHEFPLPQTTADSQRTDDPAPRDSAEPSNDETALKKMLQVHLANQNPAFAPARELVDDTDLKTSTDYPVILEEMELYFSTRPGFGPKVQTLIEMLRSPMVYSPDSLQEQLRYIAVNWSDLLKRRGFDLSRLLQGQDILKEEEKFRGGGPGPRTVTTYADDGRENYSQDSHWMPKLVLMAKNTLVWLDQLSKKYSRNIDTLDKIPNEELDLLAERGFTGLWLIGLWERSPASRRIKQLTGNPEAESSAYSLMRYSPAGSLGGEQALQNLRERAWQRGIRMACDMVPNHMGLDSDWVLNHPEWFISRKDCPYPNYSFSGENLSNRSDIEIRLEDHYYDRSDAAVVFQRKDTASGQIRYIYHGNDGTSMPWNDTAQLNYLNAGLREAVLNIVLEIARSFPVIRFDAAMTLVKRHFRRLWFPEPGSGGDIPTRFEFSLTEEEFEAAFPVEFWREVVDTVSREVPETLLLAEAFWMMEGYFVRSLGMHRVYNSAFMNMLKMEENKNFRQLVKNTLEFDPQILKRYVNFLSNPDEETAITQFGSGDKYFGSCVLLATMPGLPLFAHGQLEGFEEKYGMEYSRSYQPEAENPDLVRRHEREIFPLLHRRKQFAEAAEFFLYDVFSGRGEVNEDIIAYSNGTGPGAALVVFNNRYERGAGWIKTSAAYLDKSTGGEDTLRQKNIGENLGISTGGTTYVILRDLISGQEYLRSADEILSKGLYLELEGFQYHVFADISLVADDGFPGYAETYKRLKGRGVTSVEQVREEMFFLPLHNAFREFFAPEVLKSFIYQSVTTTASENDALSCLFNEDGLQKFLGHMEKFSSNPKKIETLKQGIQRAVQAIQQLKSLAGSAQEPERPALEAFDSIIENTQLTRAILAFWICTKELPKLLLTDNRDTDGDSVLQAVKLDRVISGILRETGLSDSDIWLTGKLLPVMITFQAWPAGFAGGETPSRSLYKMLFNDSTVRDLIGMNTFEGVEYFNTELFQIFMDYLYLMGLIYLSGHGWSTSGEFEEARDQLYAMYALWQSAERASESQSAQFLTKLDGSL